MRTKNHGPSLFSSLGQAFNLHHSPKREAPPVRRDPRAARQEYFIAENLFVLLDSLSTQKRLSFSWLKQVVVLVNSTISGAQELLPAAVQCPLNRWDEQWVSNYLDDTVKLLDVLNFVRKLVVELEQKQMMLKLVVSTLISKNGTPEERRLKASKCLQDYAAGSPVIQDYAAGSPVKPAAARNPPPAAASKPEDFSTLLEEMIPQAFEERCNPLQRGKAFLNALHGSKVVAVFLMGVIIRALGGTLRGFTEWQVPEKFAWSKPLEDLLQQVNKLTGDEKGSEVQELFLLNQELKDLRIKLESSSNPSLKQEQPEVGEIKLEQNESRLECEQVCTGGDIKSSEGEAWGLQIALKNSEEGLDLVRKELDNLFHVVVSSRNSLLARLRGS